MPASVDDDAALVSGGGAGEEAEQTEVEHNSRYESACPPDRAFGIARLVCEGSGAARVWLGRPVLFFGMRVSSYVGQIRTLEFRLEGLLLTAENSTVAAWKGNQRSIGHE